MSTRIFGGTLPPEEADDTPRAAIVLRPTGGPGTEWLRTVDQRIDIACYGATPAAAYSLALLVYDALAWLPKQTIGSGSTGGKVYRVVPELSPTSLIDPDTDWPYAVASYLVTSSRESVS